MCLCYLYTTIVFIHFISICTKVLVLNDNIGLYVTLKQNLRALYRHNNWPHILDLCACIIVLETI